MDAREFRTAMGQFATGVVVISTQVDGQPHAMTANAFLSGSLEPPLVVVSVAHSARMHERIQRSQRFAVSVLGSEQQAISNHFAGRTSSETLADFAWLDELPVIADARVQVATRLQHSHACGDHTLFVGHVTGLRSHLVDEAQAAQPLIFHAGGYRDLAEPCWAQEEHSGVNHD